MIIKNYLLNFTKKYVFVAVSYAVLGCGLHVNTNTNTKTTLLTIDSLISVCVLCTFWPATIPISSALSYYNTEKELNFGKIIFYSSFCAMIFCIIP